MTQSEIMAAYLSFEKAARANHGMLMPEDVEASIADTARYLGISKTDVADAVRSWSAMRAG